MYFSLLTIFLSGFTALFITTINLWFIPGLFRIQQVGKIYILLTLLTALIYPLRYLFLSAGVRFLSVIYLFVLRFFWRALVAVLSQHINSWSLAVPLTTWPCWHFDLYVDIYVDVDVDVNVHAHDDEYVLSRNWIILHQSKSKYG